ncbi:hypothetical protein LDENG_00121970 [Lucifuga dentata]|nr:hypothetical protein LDENG_00121970 [Lucifuga dentata]
MIFIFLTFCFFHLPLIKGSSNTPTALQTPPFIIKNITESVTSEINCSHSVPNYEHILWYKQEESGALLYLGYLNLNHLYPENHWKGKISFDGDGRKHSSLIISNLTLNDSAVYFCAIRLTRCCRNHSPLYKNPLICLPVRGS